jgi:hypothetical protein
MQFKQNNKAILVLDPNKIKMAETKKYEGG